MCRDLRVSPFRYYIDLLCAVLREEKSYDQIPNFTVPPGGPCGSAVGLHWGSGARAGALGQWRPGRRAGAVAPRPRWGRRGMARPPGGPLVRAPAGQGAPRQRRA